VLDLRWPFGVAYDRCSVDEFDNFYHIATHDSSSYNPCNNPCIDHCSGYDRDADDVSIDRTAPAGPRSRSVLYR
jgi:hypothetical protein